MKTPFILLSIYITTAQAIPARKDYGQTKSFTATNSCGITYGGTWIECASNLRHIPTFTVQSCWTSAAAVKDTAPRPDITTAPTVFPRLDVRNATTRGPHWMCIDAFDECGGEIRKYGACFDTCVTSYHPTPPPCTVTERPVPSLGAAKVQAPQREMIDECVEKPFLCPPPGC
ncbi:hypothetical protein BDW02DRAFT_492952 [Decorospora gaudefroyi]|uniref:Uncharacterized protein n=1 Tax=Decorospora gaudefroyi TaxID=184978 RepID=A0A6A5KLV7_9PLEO|nr:hypothetical protein BDW02DRAFT_492952 [Decorospora gaudefroyi]